MVLRNSDLFREERLPSSFDKQDTRLLIVAAAVRAALGAHYINGADGGITGKNSADKGGVTYCFSVLLAGNACFPIESTQKTD